MNCNGIKELLSEGRSLTASAEHHLESCAGCRAMLDALAAPESQPDKQRVERFQELLTASLQPVRRLPSDRKLVWIFLALFTGFSLAAAIPFGYNGFHMLTAFQRAAYYGLVLLFAIWFAVAAVQEMIPGSRQKANPRWLILAAIVSLAVLVSALFRNFDMERFTALGMPCLRLGSVCALVSGLLFWFVFRKGFFTAPIAAFTTMGFFAGLAGVAVLALHCPIQNAAHIIVWHLGAMVLGGLAGSIVGAAQR